jgi:hypothetical protein
MLKFIKFRLRFRLDKMKHDKLRLSIHKNIVFILIYLKIEISLHERSLKPDFHHIFSLKPNF